MKQFEREKLKLMPLLCKNISLRIEGKKKSDQC